MKKQSMRYLLIHLTRSLIIALLVIVNQTVLQAQTTGSTTSTDTPSVLVKHLGNEEQNMLFQVSYNNTTGEKFHLVIKDKDDFTLFQESYSDKVFSKRFRVPKTSNEKLIFVIKTGKNKVIQTYEANTNQRLVQEIVVKKQ